MCRSPYGERGLKFQFPVAGNGSHRRSPYGERGLKYRIVIHPDWQGIVALLTESVD